MAQNSKRLARTIQVLILFVIVASMAHLGWGRLTVLTRIVTTTSPGCSAGEQISDLQEIRERWQFDQEFAEKVRLVDQEAGQYERWETPAGMFWLPPGEKAAVSFLLAEQKHKIYGDPPCQRGDVVLDCGAHVGFFTRDALNAGAGKVVAIEPSPTNFECLRRNFAKEIEAGRVVVYPKGVWHRDEEMMIEVHAGRSAQDKIVQHEAAGAASIAVPLTTIDKLVEELGLDRVDLIKMDIEGAEANALKGAKNTIAKFKPRLSISGYHREDDPTVLPEIVRTAREDYQVTPSSCMGTHEGRILISHVIFFK